MLPIFSKGKPILCSAYSAYTTRFGATQHWRSSSSGFQLINGSLNRPELDSNSVKFDRDAADLRLMNADCDRLVQLRDQIMLGGGPDAMTRITAQKKLPARERIRALLDDFDNAKSNWIEVGLFSGLDQPYGSIPASGAVNVIGRVQGRMAALSVSDSSVKAGTVFPCNVRKIVRFGELVLRLRLPFVNVIDSGGAFLPLQADIFPDQFHGGRVFYAQAIHQAHRLPYFTLVCGSCTAGAAYIPTMSEENGIVQRTGHLFLGGPPLVRAALGENVSPDDLGGAEVHTRLSGCSDYLHASEADALHHIKALFHTLPPPQQRADYDHHHQFGSASSSCSGAAMDDAIVSQPIYPAHELRHVVMNSKHSSSAPSTEIGSTKNDDSHRKIDVILSRILDGSRWIEFKGEYHGDRAGEGGQRCSLRTGYAKIAGRPVGIVAGLGRELEFRDCLKAAHFVQICQQRGEMPLVFLCHTAPPSSSPSSCEPSSDVAAERSLNLLKARAAMMSAVCATRSAKITLVVGDAFGADYVMMGGGSSQPTFAFAWPNARFDEDPAVVMKRARKEGNRTGDNTEVSQHASVDAFSAAGNYWIDDVILPETTRQKLVCCLEVLSSGGNAASSSPQPMPILRM